MAKQDKLLVTTFSNLAEQIEILCQSDGNNETKYLDVKPEKAVNWIS